MVGNVITGNLAMTLNEDLVFAGVSQVRSRNSGAGRTNVGVERTEANSQN